MLKRAVIEIIYPIKENIERKKSFLKNKIIQAYKISEFIGMHKALISFIMK
jgi:hypothetical protein